MNIALVMDEIPYKQITQQLPHVQDNIKTAHYPSTVAFINTCLQRNLVYDRVIVMCNCLDEDLWEDLNNFWAEYSPQTKIIILGRKNRDEDVARRYTDLYPSEDIVFVLPLNITMATLTALVNLRPSELRAQYGLPVNQVEEITAEVVEEVPVEPTEPVETVPENLDASQEQYEKDNVQLIEKKPSFFSRFFGGRKKKEQTSEEPTEVDEEFSEDSSGETTENLGEEPEETIPEATIWEETGFDPFTELDENSETNSSETTGDESASWVDPFDEEPTEDSVSADEDPIPVEETNLVDEVEFRATGDISETMGEDKPVVEEVDINLGGGSIAQAEEEYRAAVDAPKTIIKEVEKIVDAPALGKDMLKSLTKGKKNILLIVTGDRGSGITSTARLIGEKTAALKIETLLIDLDTELHGILSYINFDDYASNSESITRGLKGLHKVEYVPNAIYEISPRLGLIASNYDVEMTSEDIENAQDIISECSNDIGVTLIDCPLDKLKHIPELLTMGVVCVCVECSKRGFMNLLCRLEALDLPAKYKKRIATKGKLLITKITKAVSPDKIIKQVNALYEAEDIDWLRMPYMPFDGKIDNKVLAKILGE